MKKRVMMQVLTSAMLAAAVLFASCAGGPEPAGKSAETQAKAAQASVAQNAEEKPLSLSLFHVNDTHAKLESALTELKVDITPELKAKRTFVELGGFARLWAAVETLRAEKPNSFFLHAGDVFQGTLYFTEFKGKADGDFLNAIGLDALVVGNHEFDKGPTVLADFIKDAKFPVLACNLDLSAEPSLKDSIKPYIIKEVAGAKVAIVGVANPETPDISSPGPTIKFLDPVSSLEKVVKELEAKGINKIIVLSHAGYELDKTIGTKVSGIDVVVGGHSHFILGPFADLGLKSQGDYPTVAKSPAGDPVLIVTSWNWANMIGILDVDFDKDGKITSFKGNSKLLAGLDKFRIYDLPDADGKLKRVEFVRSADGTYGVKEYDGKAYAVVPSEKALQNYMTAFSALIAKFKDDSRFLFIDPKKEGLEKLAKYSPALKALQAKIATKATDALKRGNNSGPGPIIADSMIWKTGADIAIMNPGGVRVDLDSGEISVAKVYELQPFANTLVTIDVSGEEVKNILEDMADFTISSYAKAPETAYVYVSGLKLSLMVNNAKGARVTDVMVKAKDGSWKALDPKGTYKLVVNNFMADGGDKNTTLAAIPKGRKYDTGFVDSEVMLDYVLGKILSETKEERVKNIF
ncbi:bifunctional UDP-sugar hydrolase/5'-nucleotidase [Gracilinema caldarium]|uniref:bifunctional metallophosphatase/5'-nucleotidase n=1 Tax=Gracilinema caldarium TaxID=215591 RepID=UPI0026F16127|nr:5'-nucleotidase C-terminal domain-containing protein [Gracilinema caldarium]